MQFNGRTIIVTGAGNGIGLGIAKEFGVNGANVVISDLDSQTGFRAEKCLLEDRSKAIFLQTDVRDEESVRKLFDEVVSRFGHVDVVVNNAGISQFHDFFEMSPSQWDDILNTNLRSVFLCAQAAARTMKEGRGGAIINIASTRAFMSEPNTEAYSASKGGIIALTHALARTLGPYGITVNCISPGWIETGGYELLKEHDHSQHISGRVGKPEDIARACLFFADPRNNFITGENIIIDGGMTKKMMYEE
ncbi:3-ketoacyl-ACP reductase [Neobacillus piezotolerans]|uniref:3-ketoacyl-ACP reductase n=1 Tax=Neobacillus piezotolerans TaxID=2259171 RepID=A0A3D8GW11_9BACI|nr:glucose 1-dehydrogenase [Neobacillus piezotolerans]RDU38389.1 3-ketoacyl-ACP reductase [Neobacillus piezotolerans]